MEMGAKGDRGSLPVLVHDPAIQYGSCHVQICMQLWEGQGPVYHVSSHLEEPPVGHLAPFWGVQLRQHMGERKKTLRVYTIGPSELFLGQIFDFFLETSNPRNRSDPFSWI
jgi:hypothetical protein